MSHQAETSSVRIMRTDGAVVGTGFLVAEKSILTCAHVVAAALGIAASAPTQPEAQLSLDFPLVAPGQKLTAHITFWEPIHLNGGGDIALLQLDSTPPDGAYVARLVFAEDLWEHRFRAFGFPARSDDGVWASGRLLGRQATGWVQIEGVKETGYRVQQGFSGGAVWDEQLDGVAGMVVAEDGDPSLKTAYIIPTNVLIKAWPSLGQQATPACPYRGLFAFREQDVPYFFGREAFTHELVDAVRRKPLLAVIGPSGSGKSSAVFAGLVPGLRREGSWLIASYRPGSRPFRSLAAALMPLLEPHMSETDRLTEISKLAGHLQQGTLALQEVFESITERNTGMHLLLIADQFEELYTLCGETDLRQRFLDALLAGVHTPAQPGSPTIHLVLTLRADFVGQALAYRPFADALQHADLKLGPMNRSELHDAIRKPAQKLNVKIEGGLSERILSEVSQESGHLPLLEFALTLLWAKLHDGTLTHAAYEEIGGVEKALADHADEVYAGLNEAEQAQARRIFVQLVRPGEGTEDTRRLATHADIGGMNWELVVRLSSARLVVSGRDETTGEETVEVVHEALIKGWQRLQAWMEENREFRTWQERLRGALRQWESSGRDDGALLRGALLVEASTWLTQRPEAISVQERVFIETSQLHQVEEEQYLRKLLEETEQQRQEAELQRIAAEAHRQEAELQRQIAVARGLSAQAELFRNQWSHLLVRRALLAVEAMQHFPCLEADRALRDGMLLLRRRLASLPHENSVYAVAFSPDGRLLATASSDKTAGVWEVASGRRLASLPHKDSVLAVTFSPDGRLLATASGAIIFDSASTAGVWEVASGRRLASLPHKGSVWMVTFSPDGRLLATTSSDNTARLWLSRPEDLIAEAQSLLPRNLTPGEWKQFMGDEPYRRTCPHLP